MTDTPAKPWWLTEGIFDIDHGHEPMSFLIRRGGSWEFDELQRQFDEKFSPAWAEAHARNGNFLETCFFKGLGLAAEADEMERTRRFVAACHAVGLRVGVYTQWGSIFNETFFLERPDAREWVQVDSSGKPIEYGDRGNQYFRWRGCPGHPDFIEYIKELCRIAIEDFKVDVVYFDNMCLFEFHDTVCYCDRCQAGFRNYLRSKYPEPEAMFRRLGLRSAEAVYCPPMRSWTDHTETAYPLKDPMLAEFVDFRCRQFADAWHDVYEYIQSLDPAVGLMGNPSFPRKYNERLTGAIDMWMLRRTPALYYMENAVRSIGVRDGAVVTNARGYKYGRMLGENVTFVPCGGTATPGLDFAECLAFNDGSGKLGREPGALWDFFSAHRDEFYRDVTPAARVAVLRHDRSLTLRWHETFCGMEMAQQQLGCAGVPWMPIWEHQLHDGTLEAFDVLVVPGTPCLSRDEATAIEAFVRAGGGLIACENAGAFSENHNTLAQWRFADLFGVADDERFTPRYVGRGNFATLARDAKKRSVKVGDGRAVYLPRFRGTREPVRTYAEIGGYDGVEHLLLSRGWRDLPKAVEKVAPGTGLPVTIDAPRSCWAELLAKAGGRQLLLHLVNYNAKKVAAGAKVILRGQAAERPARVFIPGGRTGGKSAAPAPQKDGSVAIKLPAFERYALVVLD